MRKSFNEMRNAYLIRRNLLHPDIVCYYIQYVLTDLVIVA